MNFWGWGFSSKRVRVALLPAATQRWDRQGAVRKTDSTTAVCAQLGPASLPLTPGFEFWPEVTLSNLLSRGFSGSSVGVGDTEINERRLTECSAETQGGSGAELPHRKCSLNGADAEAIHRLQRFHLTSQQSIIQRCQDMGMEQCCNFVTPHVPKACSRKTAL